MAILLHKEATVRFILILAVYSRGNTFIVCHAHLKNAVLDNNSLGTVPENECEAFAVLHVL